MRLTRDEFDALHFRLSAIIGEAECLLAQLAPDDPRRTEAVERLARAKTHLERAKALRTVEDLP